jgi:3-methyladenine DNA glycosylase AlkC
MIAAVHPAFPVRAFLDDVLAGYDTLELMPRGRRIAEILHRHLPQDYLAASEILLTSLGPILTQTDRNGMAPFLYLSHVFFVAQYGLDHFERSMGLQYELTQRFTAEFSIRPFLVRYPTQTLARLKDWTRDPSPHVRRLVSEGTRPRLPWAPRLRAFQENPRPVLALLELLKDDPDLYVRRSVANNLNDIGKDHPAMLADTMRRWTARATPEREWVIRHALRSAVRRGEPDALQILGVGHAPKIAIRHATLSPARVHIGNTVTIRFTLTSTATHTQRVRVDAHVHFVKANGQSRPKVFTLKTIDLPGKAQTQMGKVISLRTMTTRKPYPGRHRVDVAINGRIHPLGTFDVVAM